MLARKRRSCCEPQRPDKKVCADPPATRRRRTTTLPATFPGLFLVHPSPYGSLLQPLTEWPITHVLALVLVGPGPDPHVQETLRVCAANPWLQQHVAIVRYCRPEKVTAQTNPYDGLTLVLDTYGELVAAVGARDPLGGGCHALNSVAVVVDGRPEQLHLGHLGLDIEGILFKLHNYIKT
ncbi:uncharacterized protein SAPINGB_P002431 [Magnusiomyces paraingens]|uniref:Uncharacterized protein n=1 Tax=Magnusiomyces paraingens TaxID=2606893 RepID=A0A5E8BDV8_9ASCO|nr:uncharacterized protein SAPINGB_P002431 [Saprochaete ingens]VVT49763.1 unnamed protein product [Saprochaete ingens]